MTDMDGVSQIEVLDYGGCIGGVVIHVMTVAHLRRAAMAAPVMRDDAVALVEEIEHLGSPVVRAQRPSMLEDDRLGAPGAPILVEDFRAVLGGDRIHGSGSFACGRGGVIRLG